MGSKVDVLTTVVSKALVSYLLKVLVLVAICGLSFSARVSVCLSSVCDIFSSHKAASAVCSFDPPQGIAQLCMCRSFLLEVSFVSLLGTKASWEYCFN